MRYVNIKNTDLAPSVICLGVADIGVKNTEDESYRLMDMYLDRGGNFIDTARVYSNWVPGEKNRSERILGEWMRRRKNRDKIILATKGAHPELSTMHVPRMSKEEVQEDLEGSLKTLQTDYIDLYYLHRDDPNRPVEEIMDMLHGFQVSGKIRYYACSNWRPGRITAACTYAKEKGYTGFVANQMLWNLGCYFMKKVPDDTLAVFDKEMFEVHEETGMAAVPYSSQANGFFVKLESSCPKEKDKAKGSLYNTDKNIRIYRRAKEVCAKYNLTMTQVVLGYLISQPITTIPIVGSRSIEQLDDSITAGEIEFPQEARLELEEVIDECTEK